MKYRLGTLAASAVAGHVAGGLSASAIAAEQKPPMEKRYGVVKAGK